jgi:AcrR family transcriptional regulator
MYEMKMATAYQRARSPEQKAERTEQILSAAEEMLCEGHDSSGLSLTELAKRAGMAKSNVYRYFESREAVLLALLEDRTERWAAGAIDALAELSGRRSQAHRIDDIADVLASSAAAHPVMCHLMSVLPSVLEHNVSAESVRAYKVASLALIARLAEAMHRVLPELPAEQHGELLHHAVAFIVGSWPLAHPSPVTEEVMQEPALAPFRHDFEADLRRVFVLLARGMAFSS